jgi:hypothetical protein
VIVLVTFMVGLVVWIVSWATLDVKAFDAFIFTVLITAVAAGVQIALPFVNAILKGTPAAPGER